MTFDQESEAWRKQTVMGKAKIVAGEEE